MICYSFSSKLIKLVLSLVSYVFKTSLKKWVFEESSKTSTCRLAHIKWCKLLKLKTHVPLQKVCHSAVQYNTKLFSPVSYEDVFGKLNSISSYVSWGGCLLYPLPNKELYRTANVSLNADVASRPSFHGGKMLHSGWTGPVIQLLATQTKDIALCLK